MPHGARPLVQRLLVALACAAGVAAPITLGAPAARAEAPKVHATRGTIKAFGPDRGSVSIAHEEIPGFMMAMTMTFEPRTADQLAGLQVGDVVSFSFEVTAEGRRPLVTIQKVPAKAP